jgi:ankyrin repeat protein
LDGSTPASQAAMLGQMDCLNLLLENGADLKIKNNQQLTGYQQMLVMD